MGYDQTVVIMVFMLVRVSGRIAKEQNISMLKVKILLTQSLWPNINLNLSVTLTFLIVSITKFLIVIGLLHAYLSCNLRVIMWVSNYRCLIWAFCSWIHVIRDPHDSHVNYACFNGFLRNVSFSFQNLGKALQTFKRSSHKSFFIPKFVIDTIN